MADKFWMGSPIGACDICQGKIKDEFVDGKTGFGPWAIMCPSCHMEHGGRLGTGLGQRYRRDGHRWKKVAG